MISFALPLITSSLAVAQIASFNPLGTADVRAACPRQPNCTEWKEEDICFMGFEPKFSEGLKELAYQKTCGWSAKTFQTRSPEELRAAITELSHSCVRIKNLTIASHGSPGALHLFPPGVPPITIDNLKSHLGLIGCWTQANSEIIASGCNIGNGCEGDNFLYQTATQLLPEGGKVRGSTDLSATLLPGVLPVMSLDGNKAQITYDPNKKPSTTWQNRGEIFGIETPRNVSNQACLDKIYETARAMGPSGALSGACASQQAQLRNQTEIDRVIARMRVLPPNRFGSPGFLPAASGYQAIQGAMYDGSICSSGGAIGITLPAAQQRPGAR